MTANDGFDSGQTLEIPAVFLKALAENAEAGDAFDGLAPADQREWIDWVAQGDTADDRDERSRQAIERILAGRRPAD